MDREFAHEMTDVHFADAVRRWERGELVIDFESPDGGSIPPSRIALLRSIGGPLENLSFAGAVFEEHVDFSRAEFVGGCPSFEKAVFCDGVSFRLARFSDCRLNLVAAKIKGRGLSLRAIEMSGAHVRLRGAEIQGDTLSLRRSNLKSSSVDLSGVEALTGKVDAREVRIEDSNLSLDAASLLHRLRLSQATLARSRVTLLGGEMCGGIDLSETTLDEAIVEIAPDECRDVVVNLTKARCHGPSVVSVRPGRAGDTKVLISEAEIRKDLTLRCDNASIRADGIVVRAPLALRASPDFPGHLLSLDGADVTARIWVSRDIQIGSTIWGKGDLSQVALASIDSLRTGKGGRRVLAADTDDVGSEELHTLERNYSDLRRQLEASGRTHEANDLYYGEMRARQRALPTNSPERWMLAAYRLISAYGTRALPALLAWVLMTVVAADLLRINGVDITEPGEAVSFREAWQFTSQAAYSIFRPTGAPDLSYFESALMLCVRFSGPVLLALAALAVRNRVRR